MIFEEKTSWAVSVPRLLLLDDDMNPDILEMLTYVLFNGYNADTIEPTYHHILQYMDDSSMDDELEMNHKIRTIMDAINNLSIYGIISFECEFPDDIHEPFTITINNDIYYELLCSRGYVKFFYEDLDIISKIAKEHDIKRSELIHLYLLIVQKMHSRFNDTDTRPETMILTTLTRSMLANRIGIKESLIMDRIKLLKEYGLIECITLGKIYLDKNCINSPYIVAISDSKCRQEIHQAAISLLKYYKEKFRSEKCRCKSFGV